jgi:hypothetical protein
VADIGNRISSIFAYLDVNCIGGTTEFPQIPRPLKVEWCDLLVCEDENGDEVEHLEIRPILGNAIFWWNLGTDGEGDARTLHAGLPVIKGTKAGLNIWTREKAYREPQVDSDSEDEVDDEYMIPYSSYSFFISGFTPEIRSPAGGAIIAKIQLGRRTHDHHHQPPP